MWCIPYSLYWGPRQKWWRKKILGRFRKIFLLSGLNSPSKTPYWSSFFERMIFGDFTTNFIFQFLMIFDDFWWFFDDFLMIFEKYFFFNKFFWNFPKKFFFANAIFVRRAPVAIQNTQELLLTPSGSKVMVIWVRFIQKHVYYWSQKFY